MIPIVAGPDPAEVRKRVLAIREERLRRARRARAHDSIAYAITRVWPWFVLEEIHLLICGYLESLEQAVIDRLMIFMAPRAGKSQIASIMLPAHYLGRHPQCEVMQAGHSKDLSIGFGRLTRMLVRMSQYQELFPGMQMAPDSTAAGRWHTTEGGQYIATGVTGGISGKGFHLGIIDDPLSEQDARSKLAQETVFQWYGPGFYTRASPDAPSSILAMGTRWDKNDLFGRLLALPRDSDYVDRWTVLRVPAIIDADTAEILNELSRDPLLITERHPKRYKFKAGDSFAPRRWPMQKLLRIKANQSTADWEALYQQNPTQEEGNILKRSWWRKWPHEKPPKCKYLIQVYDTAFSEPDQKNNAFTARTTWGIFDTDDAAINKDGIVLPSSCAILLDRFNKRVGFPELRAEAKASYEFFKRPDRVLVEKKASGISLVQELRRARIPVTPVKAEVDKIARAYAASGVLEHGFIYYMPRDWANEVIDQCAEFPTGGFSDLVDTCVHAWMWLRRTYHLHQPLTDEEEKEGVDLMPRRLYG